LIVETDEASIDLPEDPAEPLPWTGTMQKTASGCAGVLEFIVAEAAGAGLTLALG